MICERNRTIYTDRIVQSTQDEKDPMKKMISWKIKSFKRVKVILKMIVPENISFKSFKKRQ
jgi:hypothetical protein